MDNKWSNLQENIEKASTILLSTHKNPDGDGLGSELSMYYYLKSLNKEVRIINISELSSRYKFMDKDNVVETYSENMNSWISQVDLVIVFDLGDFNRLGEIAKQIKENQLFIINVDHHIPKDESVYNVSIIDSKAPATTYMCWKYYQFLGMNDKKLDDQMAYPLYVGLINDTGSFRYDGVNSETHEMASHLLLSDINPNNVYRNVYENKTYTQIKMLSMLIDNISFNEDKKAGYAIITQTMFDKTGAIYDDAEGFSDFIRAIEGIEVSFTIIEKKDCMKISFRSRGNYTVNDIAQIFGGGGHYFASGCEIKKNEIDNSINIILEKLQGKFDGN